jgi:hypothetical protein
MWSSVARKARYAKMNRRLQVNELMAPKSWPSVNRWIVASDDVAMRIRLGAGYSKQIPERVIVSGNVGDDMKMTSIFLWNLAESSNSNRKV